MKKQRHSHRRALAVLAVALSTMAAPTALVSTAPPAGAVTSGGGYGYVWADQPSTASYTPYSSYSANSTGAHNTVTRNAKGNYTVIFPGLGNVGAGTADVTAYETSGWCKVVSWLPVGSAMTVNIQCLAPGGAAQDSNFDALFAAATTSPPPNLSYLWADQPTAASYTPSLGYQFNSGGGTDTITRNSTGNYNVSIPGVGLNAGTVKVTGYDVGGNRNCRVGSWGGSPTLVVNVLCSDSFGNPGDARFSMTWVNKASLLAKTGGKWAYVWADDPSSASYTPISIYQGNAYGATNTITRSDVGWYAVHIPYLVGGNGDVQVSAYGSTVANCNSGGWGNEGGYNAIVYVRCYDHTGAPIDTSFTAQYFVS